MTINPCPFCGEKFVEVETSCDGCENPDGFAVVCGASRLGKGCAARGPLSVTSETAIDAWNRAPLVDRPGATVIITLGVVIIAGIAGLTASAPSDPSTIERYFEHRRLWRQMELEAERAREEAAIRMLSSGDLEKPDDYSFSGRQRP